MQRQSDLAWSLDSLVGRTTDLEAVQAKLAASRLVTITGPGGTGKTRLARAVLNARAADSWFVDLSGTHEAAMVLPAIASALSVDDRDGTPALQSLVRTLADRPSMVVLDNLEQISSIGEVITTLLTSIPEVQILGTSRLPLGVVGEDELALEPLGLPVSDEPQEVAASPAGALFLARARAVGRLQELDDSTAAETAALLRRLDGLPLAIELAAARTRALTPAEILKRLDERGAAGVGRVEGDESRSLLAVLEWTLGLLSPEADDVLGAAAVCHGFDLELVEAMLRDADVLEGVETLITLGLVKPFTRDGRRTRYRLLEVIRDEAGRRLGAEQRGTLVTLLAKAMVSRAAASYAAHSRRWPELKVDAEENAANYLMALDHWEKEDPTQGLWLWHHLHQFWRSHGRVTDGIERFERLRRRAPEPSVALARSMADCVELVQFAYGEAQAVEMHRSAIAIADAVGDRWAQVEGLVTAAAMAFVDRDLVDIQEVAARLDALGEDREDVPKTKLNLLNARAKVTALVHGMDSDQAIEALRRVYRAVQEAADDGGQTEYVTSNLAETHVVRGEYEQAIRMAEESVAACRASGNDRLAGYMLGSMAGSLANLGRIPEAVAALREAQAISMPFAEPDWLVDHLRQAVYVALAADRPLLAAEAWGLAINLVESNSASIQEDDRSRTEKLLGLAARRLRGIEWELAIQDGRAADPIAFIKGLPDRIEGERPNAPARSGARLRHGELTNREVEILKLVGQGRSDPEIAAELFISPKTASVHVANIKSKLGLQSRLEVALKARELGLVDALSSAMRADQAPRQQ